MMAEPDNSRRLPEHCPAALRDLKAWLLWRYVQKPGEPKPRKVPYYASGGVRRGLQGSLPDRKQLVTFDQARAACTDQYDGLGLALMPEWGISALDIDGCLTAGELHSDVPALVAGTYAEISPSGRGVRAFVLGDRKDASGVPFGIETFHAHGFVTFTGHVLDECALCGDDDTVATPSAALLDLVAARFSGHRDEADCFDDDPLLTYSPPIGLREDQLTEILDALDPDMQHDTWLAVGMALHHETGGEGFSLWDEWSSTAVEKYPGSEALERRWESFGRSTGRKVTARYLLRLAKENGAYVGAARAGSMGGYPKRDHPSNSWPEPQPLSAKVEPEPYPLDALPETIRAAVQEVQSFVKAPLPMVASSALGALSLACQAHVDVKRCDKLTGPTSLFLLTLGDSGERKSTCDGFFLTVIRDYQGQQAWAMELELERFQAAIDAWTAERNGMLETIKTAGRKGQSTDDLRASLAQLQHDKPEAPRVPHLLLGDETPENLAWRLAKQWPSAGVISSEAGQILGAHGMGKDSVMRNLGLLNVLWDGGAHSVGRRTSESFTVKGARLTVALQIQEPTLRSFFDKSGALARGTGFLARFLVAWPESTQGYRPFSDPPEHWPSLARFHQRIAEILNQAAPIGGDGALTPQMLSLTQEAKAAWIEFHDAIEAELRPGGDLHDVQDVASKSADNAVRLAALFHVFEHGSGAVSLESFEGASRIAAWHLNESRRFFGELALPAQLADASRLDSWLIEYCRRERTDMVPVSAIQKSGPGGLRNKATMDPALRELEELDRARRARGIGKGKIIKVNPSLLGFAAAVIAVPAVIGGEQDRKTAKTSKTATATAAEGKLA